MVSAFLLREKRSEERQTAMQIKTVNRAQDRQSWQGKLEDEQMPIYVGNARDFRARQFLRNGEREISRAGSKIDNFIRAPVGHDFRGAVSPIKISAATEQMVGEIVAAG